MSSAVIIATSMDVVINASGPRLVFGVAIPAPTDTLEAIESVGGGAQVYKATDGNTAKLRSITGGANVTVTQGVDDITIASTSSLSLSDDNPASVADSSTAGSSVQASRSDHEHGHGQRQGGNTHPDATTLVSGFLSAADKTDLDGVVAALAATAPNLTVRGNVSGGAAVPVDLTGTAIEAVIRAALGGATANVDVNAKRITSLADPVANQDGATRHYVDTRNMPVYSVGPAVAFWRLSNPSGPDDTPILNVLASIPSTGGVLYFPPDFTFGNTYVMTSTLTLPANRSVTVRGEIPSYLQDGPELSTLQFTMTDGTSGIAISGIGRSKFASVEYLSVAGTTTMGPCIEVSDCAKMDVHDVWTKYGSYGVWVNNAFIINITKVKSMYAAVDGFYGNGNEIWFHECAAVYSGVWGYHTFGVANQWIGDISTTGTPSAGGGFYIEGGSNNYVEGYWEPTDEGHSARFGQFGVQAIGNEARNMFHGELGDIVDLGIANLYGQAQGSSCEAIRHGVVTNLFDFSAFDGDALADSAWFGSATLSIDTTSGVSSGRSLKIVNPTAGTTANAERYLAPVGAPYYGTRGALVAGDTIVLTGWIRANKPMGLSFPATPKISLHNPLGTLQGGPTTFVIPYADTEWRQFAMLIKLTADAASLLVEALLSASANGDWIEITDLMCAVNPSRGINPFSIPFIRTGANSLTGRTVSFEWPPRQMAELVEVGGDGSSTRDGTTLRGKKTGLTSGAPVSLADLALATLQEVGGAVSYTAYASDGTNLVSTTGRLLFGAVNKAGAYTKTALTPTEESASSGGSAAVAVTWSLANGTNKLTLKATPTVTGIMPTSIRLSYRIECDSPAAVTRL